MLEVECTQCGTLVAVRESDIGRKARCPGCQTIFVIPKPAHAAGPAGRGHRPGSRAAHPSHQSHSPVYQRLHERKRAPIGMIAGIALIVLAGMIGLFIVATSEVAQPSAKADADTSKPNPAAGFSHIPQDADGGRTIPASTSADATPAPGSATTDASPTAADTAQPVGSYVGEDDPRRQAPRRDLMRPEDFLRGD